MNKPKIKAIIAKLLEEIEEEDVGISLLTTHYQDVHELSFFQEKDRPHIKQILEKLCQDSKHHKEILERIITLLGGIGNAK